MRAGVIEIIRAAAGNKHRGPHSRHEKVTRATTATGDRSPRVTNRRHAERTGWTPPSGRRRPSPQDRQPWSSTRGPPTHLQSGMRSRRHPRGIRRIRTGCPDRTGDRTQQGPGRSPSRGGPLPASLRLRQARSRQPGSQLAIRNTAIAPLTDGPSPTRKTTRSTVEAIG